ncbi:HAMP domain-containing protein [Pseudoteredinibacter isoporae]|uniref:HAMP domain-containing protein n=1 Tax=Pseudoteredinibacter isoporae TaxID=570281 RepID=A0A7X0MY19_9GAMM|nr:HAMP domain-containing protein [Pseudoteredinibacter isoporae]MBB6523800.1 HAMP domain-containing protein [Pseudoteredinibacter isoporae]NHO89320.1 HAMP domain-containing protein [Pseudoteredinibacter isoporae]NIB22427.1 HAMP domain-containing protein [Pseudoteredinibacter isoporae]
MKLGTKATLFGLLLILIALVNLIFHNQTARLEQQSTLMLASAESLERDIQNLQEKARAYGANAPRDYQSYYRDVALYHKEFQQTIAALENDNSNIARNLEDLNGGSALLQLSAQNIDTSYRQWNERFSNFLNSYHEAIGEDLNEPRLEWAAQRIREQGESLEALAGTLLKNADEYNQLRQSNQQKFALALALAVIAVSLMFTVWFFISVIKPVKRLAETTNKVAEGNFGLQLSARGSDEVAEVTGAFNSLSVRIDLILKLLDQLEEGAGEQQAVDAVMDICGEYFNVDWVGMILLEKDKNLRLNAASPASSLKRWFAKSAVAEEGNLAEFICQHIVEKRLWLESDIDSFSLQIRDSRLMRELMRNTHAHSVLGIPLGDVGKRRGMLLLASKNQDLLDGKRGELLMKLTPLISQRTLGVA